MTPMTKVLINGYSKTVYDGKSTTEQTTYVNYLNGLAGNSFWFLVGETYIPTGATITIPANVTIVQDGGYFSGTGALLANKTKIDAGFVQVFEDTLTLTGYWDIAIAHPEWFGTVDPILISDSPIDILNLNYVDIASSSKKIQKAIGLIYTNTFYVKLPKQNNVYPTLATMFYGGRVVCKPYSLYFIETAINLPLGISFDGGNSNFVYNIPAGLLESASDNLAAKYMFKININNDLNDWTVEQRGQSDTISNIRMVNNIYLSNDNQQLKYKFARGIYSGTQCCVFENIESLDFNQTFQRLASGATDHPSIGGRYIDNITLRNITINAPLIKFQENTVTSPSYALESPYQIDTGYVGDNLMIDNVAIGYTVKNPRGIKIVACTGGVIQRITNGTIYIQNSKSITLSGVHQEIGNLIIENSQVDVNGYTHFKWPGIPCLKMINRTGTNDNRSVTFRNVMILYNQNRNFNPNISPPITFSNEEIDIDFGLKTGYNIGGILKIENVYRSIQGPYVELSSLYGIRTNNDFFMKNAAANSISSIVIGSNFLGDNAGLINNFISFQIPNGYDVVDSVYDVKKTATSVDTLGKGTTLPADTYDYFGVIFFDFERKIGIDPNPNPIEIVVNANSSYYNVINFRRSYYAGLYIRLFRIREIASKIEYIDIPVCTSHNMFYDFGTYTSFGETWTNIDYETEEFSDYFPDNCTAYQFFGNNVKVSMPAYPTKKGNWKQGDIINYGTTNVNLGTNKIIP